MARRSTWHKQLAFLLLLLRCGAWILKTMGVGRYTPPIARTKVLQILRDSDS